ncbi:hypothetical protein CGRA01v4_14666 [Colletotrichum graminicola]|nr:hypothetical protein CGRA01v4_14666 [Colletotrichum graminicola]
MRWGFTFWSTQVEEEEGRRGESGWLR